MHCRAEVVHESGQGELFAAQAAAGLLGGLEHKHPQASLGESHGGNESVRPRADDDRVDLGSGGGAHSLDPALP